ncbi:MAG: protein kinase [Bryobacteraceae bacterium]
MIGQYRIEQLIGRGGMGEVYLAVDEVIGREVAIKVVRGDFGHDPEAVTELRSRLLKEARAAGVLTHPGIITIYQAGQQDDLLFIAMEFIHGCSLEKLITDSPVPARLAMHVLFEAASALDFAHARGVLHRDVKPSNILLDRAGRVKLCDFGIAKWLTAQQATASIYLLGSPNYMAPEQASGEPLSAAADQYSLGVVAFELLSGCRPFSAETLPALLHCHISTPPPVEPLLAAGVPREAVAAILRALAKTPEQRFPSCLAFVESLAAAWPASTWPQEGEPGTGFDAIRCSCKFCLAGTWNPAPSAPQEAAVRARPAGMQRSPEVPPVPEFQPAPEAGSPAAGASRPAGRPWRRAAPWIFAGLALFAVVLAIRLLPSRNPSSPADPADNTEIRRDGVLEESGSALPLPGGRAAAGNQYQRSASLPTDAGPARHPEADASRLSSSKGPVPRSLAADTAGSDSPFALQSDAPWPTASGNASRTSICLAPGMGRGAIAWKVSLPGAVRGSPVVDKDGNVYVATTSPTLHAIADGIVRWSAGLPAPPASGPDILRSGRLSIRLQDGSRWYARPDGRLEAGPPSAGVPERWAVDGFQRVYYFEGNTLLRLHASDWSQEFEETSEFAPVIDASGNIVVAFRSGRLRAIRENGSLSWQAVVPARITSPPALLPDGSLVFGTLEGQLYCIRAGAVLWRQSLGAALLAGVAVSADGTFYAPALNGVIHAFRADGTPLWKLSTGSEFRAAPALDAAGRLLVGTAARQLLCIADVNP